MKKLLIILLLCALSSCAFKAHKPKTSLAVTSQQIVLGDKAVSLDKTKVIIAVLLPLNEPYKSLSDNIVKAIQLAYNSSRNLNVLLRFYNTNADNKNTAGLAAATAIDEGCDVIVGPLSSASALDVYNVAKKHNISVFTLSNDRTILKNTHNLFLMGYSPEIEVERILDYATKAKGSSRFVAMVPDNKYGNIALTSLKSSLENRGLTLLRYVVYPENTVNFTPYVEKLIEPSELARYKQAVQDYYKNHSQAVVGRSLVNTTDYPRLNLDFDSIFIGDMASRMLLLAVHLPYVGIDLTHLNLLGTRLWGGLKIGGENIFGNAMFPNFVDLNNTIFASKFSDIFKNQATLLGAAAYDTIKLLYSLIKVDNITHKISYDFSEEAVVGQLRLGVLGNYTVRSDGLVKRTLDVIGVDNNHLTVLDGSLNSNYIATPNYQDVPLFRELVTADLSHDASTNNALRVNNSNTMAALPTKNTLIPPLGDGNKSSLQQTQWPTL